MHGFNVLDPNLSLFKNYFLEASAGTGKTYTIEHLIVRHLAQKNGPSIEEILVVTFTKTAVAELKLRIHNTLFKIAYGTLLPDYFIALTSEELFLAKQKLRKALHVFDEIKIFTIHGFCFRLLQEHSLEMGLSFDQLEENEGTEALTEIVKDFLRTELNDTILIPKQMEKLLIRYNYNIDALALHLAKIANGRLPIEGGNLEEAHLKIKEQINELKKSYFINVPHLIEDLIALAPYFGKLCDRSKQVKPEIVKGFYKFAHLFEKEDFNDLDLSILKMVPGNALKSRKGDPELHYPNLLQRMQITFFPLIEKYMDEDVIFAFLAERLRHLFDTLLPSKDLIFFEDLLKKTATLIKCPESAKNIRELFRVVLIDEFQDTDPLQWSIFSTLFLNKEFRGVFYLVGDPKQSIYRFRNADLYAYLKAKKAIGEENIVTLQKNFRSEKPLIDALNYLFQEAPSFIELPQLQENIPIPTLIAADQKITFWSDGKKSLIFCPCQKEEELFQLIEQEIEKLHTQDSISYRECAILVKDRYQAERLGKSVSLPLVFKRARSLIHSTAFPIMKDLIWATLDPKDRNRLSLVLGGPLFNWPLSKMQESFEKEILFFYKLQEILEQKGILSFLNALFDSQVSTIFERKEGELLYEDLWQLGELAAKEVRSLDEYLPFFQMLEKGDPESEKLRAYAPNSEDAVNVMTIHASKGLEFAVVFPIGVIAQISLKPQLVRHSQKEVFAFSDEDPLFAKESAAESMRTLYVALTRAKKRLYVPCFAQGPIHAFMEQVLKGRTLDELVKATPHFSLLSPSLTQKIQKEILHPELHFTPLPDLQFPKKFIHSYSSLSQVKEDKPLFVTSSTAPSGLETGVAVHYLFEKLPFAQIFKCKSKDECFPFLLPIIEKTSLAAHKEWALDIVWNALHATLPAKTPFSLSNLDPLKIKKEMEFLYPTKEGLIKGFIDLFFEHEEVFYLLDWKTNELGDSYQQEPLQKVMELYDYTLQATLYQEAILRYLDLFGKRDCFGGCFYMFVRGVQPNGHTGIIYIAESV